MADTPGNDAPHRLITDVEFGRDVVVHPFTNLYGCRIGDGTRIGPFVEIQRGAVVGARCKISSHTFICDGVEIHDEVFVGHGVVFVNDKVPRATNDDGALQTAGDWTLLRVVVRRGASIGSGAVILGGVAIGERAVVGAGAVVTRDVAAWRGRGGKPCSSAHAERLRLTPRSVVGRLTRHLNSVLTRGPGYEHTPRGPRFDPARVHGYPIDFTAKTTSPTAASPRDLLPAALAQLALGWFERHLAGEEAAADRFRATCDLLADRAVEDDAALLWLYHLDDRKYHVPPPTISCLSQAQAVSVFLRRHALDGRQEDADRARRAARPLLDDGGRTVVARLDEGLALEEAPSAPPSLILNGWMYALWGLRELSLAFDDVGADERFTESVACLLQLLPRYDVGWWSRYSLYPHRLPDLAKLFYHRLHVDQLGVMYDLTGEELFRAVAGRWRRYDTTVHRVRLTAQKARFVASGYR